MIVVKPDTDFDYDKFLLVFFDWYNPLPYQRTRTTGNSKKNQHTCFPPPHKSHRWMHGSVYK